MSARFFDPHWGLRMKVAKEGDKACRHQWKKIREEPRPVAYRLLGKTYYWRTGPLHCGSFMARARLTIRFRCRCGAEAEHTYGSPGWICLACHYAEGRDEYAYPAI